MIYLIKNREYRYRDNKIMTRDIAIPYSEEKCTFLFNGSVIIETPKVTNLLTSITPARRDELILKSDNAFITLAEKKSIEDEIIDIKARLVTLENS